LQTAIQHRKTTNSTDDDNWKIERRLERVEFEIEDFERSPDVEESRSTATDEVHDGDVDDEETIVALAT
jgi:hypothetical protein